jgi:hypothetical protein
VRTRRTILAILEHLLKIGIGKLQDPAPAAEKFGNCPAVEGGMFTFIIFVVSNVLRICVIVFVD